MHIWISVVLSILPKWKNDPMMSSWRHIIKFNFFCQTVFLLLISSQCVSLKSFGPSEHVALNDRGIIWNPLLGGWKYDEGQPEGKISKYSVSKSKLSFATLYYITLPLRMDRSVYHYNTIQYNTIISKLIQGFQKGSISKFS